MDYRNFDHGGRYSPSQPKLVNIKEVTRTLFSDDALKAAEACQDKNQNKSSQLRRFYDELVMWQEKVFAGNAGKETRQERFDDCLPYIQMMRAKVAYAEGRKLVNNAFSVMFDNLIKQIDSPETLKTARLFLEAFMGFKKGLEG